MLVLSDKQNKLSSRVSFQSKNSLKGLRIVILLNYSAYPFFLISVDKFTFPENKYNQKMYQNAYIAAASGCAEPDCERDPLISQEPPMIPVEHDYSGFDIVKATQYGAIGRVRELIESGWDVNQPDNETVTLLHWAAINNRKDIIKYFLEKGAIVDAVGGELNATPLHWATRQGHLSAVVLLVSAGADPSLRDAEGCSCIHLAAQFGHTALVGYFIARGLNPDLQDRGGMTALMWAAWKVSAIDPVRLLLTLGANCSLADNTHGNTALHWAILARNTTTISTLIFKVRIDVFTPLFYPFIFSFLSLSFF